MALEQAGLQWLNQNLQGFIRGANQGSEAMGKVGDAAEQSSTRTSVLTGAITGMATAITTTLISAVGKASQAIVGLASESVALAGDFQGMASRLTIAAGDAGKAADEFGGLSEVALAVGGDTRLMGVSAVGAADAMTGLLKAGVPLNDVMGDLNAYMEEGAELGGLLRASIDLAAATELDMVAASDLASVAMATYGLTTEQTADAMDFMVRAADASVAEVSGLRDAMVNVGASAAAMGFSIEETNQALAILSTRGIVGAEAGTALKSMMTNLMRTTPAVTEALEANGIALYDAEGNMFSMVEIIGQFQAATENMTEAQRNQFVQTVAGTYGMKSMNTLLETGVEGWFEMGDAIEGATGIQAQAEAQAATFGGQMESLEGNIETLKIRIGTALLPTITDLMGWFSSMVDQHGPAIIAIFESVGATAKQLSTALVEGGIEAVLEEIFGSRITGIIDTFKGILAGLPSAFDTINAAVQPFVKIIGETLAAAFQTIATEIWPVLKEAFAEIKAAFVDAGLVAEDKSMSLKDVLTAVAKGIVLAVGIITGAIKGIAEVIKVVAQIFRSQAQNFKSVIDGIKGWFEGLRELFQAKTFGEAVAAIGKMFKNVLKIVKAFGKSIIQQFLLPFKVIGKFLEGFVKGVIDLFKNLAKKLVGSSIIPDMMEAIFDVITSVMEAVANFIDDILDTIVNIFERGLALVVSVVKSALEKLQSTFQNVMDNIKELIENAADAIVKIWEALSTTLKTVWDSTWTAIQNAFSRVKDAIVSAIEGFKSTLESLWDSLTTNLKNAWDALWEGLINGLATTLDTIRTAIETGIQSAIDAITAMLSQFITAGEDIANSIRDGIVEAWNNITTAISNGITAIGTTIAGLAETIRGFGETIVTRMREGLVAIWNTAAGFVGALREKFQSLVADIGTGWNAVLDAGKEIVEKIKEGLANAWNTLTSWVGQALSGAVDGVKGIADAVAAAADNIIAGGKAILDLMKQGIQDAWTTFVNWIRDEILDIISDLLPGSEPKDPLSPLRGLEDRGAAIIENIAKGMKSTIPLLSEQLSTATSMPAQSVMGPSSTTRNIDQSRSITVEVNPTYMGTQSVDEIYYDISAALAAVNL